MIIGFSNVDLNDFSRELACVEHRYRNFDLLSVRRDRAAKLAAWQSHLRQRDIASRCAGADEVQHLARRDREVLRHVRRYECGGVVRRDNRSRVKGDPKGERRSEPHLPGLTSERCASHSSVLWRSVTIEDQAARMSRPRPRVA
jgi:hypothetical protein